MGILDLFRHNKIKEPIFYNEHEDKRLEVLEDLLNKVGDDQKDVILEQMNLIRIGLDGEKSVIFELMHSHEKIVFLHDITLPNVMTDSQIDFIVITRKGLLVLETKKLIGDVTIDNEGNFIRSFKNSNGVVYKKEGIYSPITQNIYHIDALKKLLIDNRYSKNIPIFSLVIIANPKTIINKKYAKSDIKKKVIKYDQLNNNIKEIITNTDDVDLSDNTMLEIADLLVNNDTGKSYDFVSKLNLKLIEEPEKIITESIEEVSNSSDELYELLRTYRYKKAKELNVQPYVIFSNEILEQLILKKPKNKIEFIEIKGLGENKYNSFGKDIIHILYPDLILEDENDIPELSNNINLSDEKLEQLRNELKTFRTNMSKEENVPVYFIFNNEQMEDLIIKMPKTLEELYSVKGFGKAKIEKYGIEIINILNKYR